MTCLRKSGQPNKVDFDLPLSVRRYGTMVNMRKRYNSKFRAKVALEAVKAEKTLAELSIEFGVHPNQIGRWRKQLLETLPELFSGRRNHKPVIRGRRYGNDPV